VVELLERAVRRLEGIESRLAETRVAPGTGAAIGGSASAPAVEWLEDEELAGRLHRILRGQARRRGIVLP
jgi:hypothetical protein